MSNHFYYDYPFIMSNLTKSEYSFIMGSLLLCVTSFIMGPSFLIINITCSYSPSPALVTSIHTRSSSRISLTLMFDVTITITMSAKTGGAGGPGGVYIRDL